MNLGSIRTKVRRKIDEEAASFWSDDELDDYINQAYRYYLNKLLELSHPILLTSTNLSIVAGTSTIALPSDYIEARLVEHTYPNYTRPLQYVERYDQVNGTSGNLSAGCEYTYCFMGNNLVLQPTPVSSEVGSATAGIKLTYFYLPDDLSDDADEPIFSALYHDLLVLNAVLQAKEKEEAVGNGGSDSAPFKRTLMELEEAFINSAEKPTSQREYVERW